MSKTKCDLCDGKGPLVKTEVKVFYSKGWVIEKVYACKDCMITEDLTPTPIKQRKKKAA